MDHFNNLFGELWKNGIGAQQRIKDIGQGVETSDIEIITNPEDGYRLFLGFDKVCKPRSVDNGFYC